MIVVLKRDASDEEKSRIRAALYEKGCVVREMDTAGQSVIGAIGRGDLDPGELRGMAGVSDVVPINGKFKLVSRQWHPEDSQVKVGPIVIGGQRVVITAGPCAVESADQALTIAREVKRYGAALFRAGAYKPRTSPYSFQGLEEAGLQILARVRQETGLPVVTEITSPNQAELMRKYVDMVQVGARNMQNFELLKCVGRLGMPVLLKRGLASTIEEWLMSAEYILAEGNDNVVLCERGIRTYEPYTRNTLDLSAIPVLKKLTHLPVVVDPSHATGIREKVAPMARAAVAAGADGLMVEVHHEPDKALSDGPQSLYPEQFGQLTRDIYVIAPVVGKQLDFDYLEKAGRHPRKSTTAQAMAAYLGEPGSFSHMACRQYLGDDIEMASQTSFRAIFEAVHRGETQYGVVPLENALTGSIHENYDLLLAYDLNIVGELYLRIIHHLIAAAPTPLDRITHVLASEPAIHQCRQFLERHPQWQITAMNSTTSAVARLKKEIGQPGYAAIGSRDAADIYQMSVIASGIETNPRNYTRFVVIGKAPLTERPKTKSSIVFSTVNQPGALIEVMRVFAENRINLVKLESRPIHGKPWQYMFYADVEADVLSDPFQAPMAQIAAKTDFLKILGVY